MSRWPEPVREPLAIGVLTELDIQDALFLCVQHSREPEDPEFDVVTFGALGAAQAALIECAEVLSLNRIGRALAAERPSEDHTFREFQRCGEDLVARRVARRVINELRKWLPEVTYG